MTTFLRRYTDVLSLLDILRHNRLTLLPSSKWYDQNDTLGLNKYSELRGRGSVFALCLAEGNEQAHHWQLFAGHSHGVCIQFDRDQFVHFLNELTLPVLHGKVIYQNLSEVRARKPIDLDALPFLKRDTFRAEQEYRVVAWEDDFFSTETYTIPMPAKMIKKITLGPSMPEVLAKTLKDIACDQFGCAEIPFMISRLVNNASWNKAISEGLSSTKI